MLTLWLQFVVSCHTQFEEFDLLLFPFPQPCHSHSPFRVIKNVIFTPLQYIPRVCPRRSVYMAIQAGCLQVLLRILEERYSSSSCVTAVELLSTMDSWSIEMLIFGSTIGCEGLVWWLFTWS